MERFFVRKTIVRCPDCKKEFDSKKVKFINIEEDVQGYDLMTFECPECKKEVQSHVRG